MEAQDNRPRMVWTTSMVCQAKDRYELTIRGSASPASQQRADKRHASTRQIHAILEALATTFYRKRAAILRYIMPWGLSHSTAWTIELLIPDCPHLVHLLVKRQLPQQVQDAAEALGASTAAWERHAMRLVTREDGSARWRTGGQLPGRTTLAMTVDASCCAWTR
jgi:hypothetical protein